MNMCEYRLPRKEMVLILEVLISDLFFCFSVHLANLNFVKKFTEQQTLLSLNDLHKGYCHKSTAISILDGFR